MKDTSFTINEIWDIHWMVRHMRHKYKRRVVHAITGSYFTEDGLNSVISKVMEYKWLECEKAGHNRYAAFGSAEAQLIAAGREWWSTHARDFAERIIH